MLFKAVLDFLKIKQKVVERVPTLIIFPDVKILH